MAGPSSRTGTARSCLEHGGAMGGQLSSLRKEEKCKEVVRVIMLLMMLLIGDRGRENFESE